MRGWWWFLFHGRSAGACPVGLPKGGKQASLTRKCHRGGYSQAQGSGSSAWEESISDCNSRLLLDSLPVIVEVVTVVGVGIVVCPKPKIR